MRRNSSRQRCKPVQTKQTTKSQKFEFIVGISPSNIRAGTSKPRLQDCLVKIPLRRATDESTGSEDDSQVVSDCHTKNKDDDGGKRTVSSSLGKMYGQETMDGGAWQVQ